MKGELDLLIGGRRTMLCTRKFMPVPGVSQEPFKPLQDTAGHSTAQHGPAQHGTAGYGMAGQGVFKRNGQCAQQHSRERERTSACCDFF
jgi:hypothetical protein